MNSDLKRARSLIREESRNRRAVDHHLAHRFDLEAVLEVRRTAGDLLETLGFIARDDAFWERLRDSSQTLRTAEIEALDWFDDAGLATLLVAAGYRSPPPPAVDTLVSDARHAIGFALAEGPEEHHVEEARRRLLLFLWRARRQIEVTDQHPLAAGTVSTVARSLGRVARQLIPVTVGVAAGLIVESQLPFTGAGIKAGMSASAVAAGVLGTGLKTAVEKGSEWAAGAVIGQVMADPAPAQQVPSPETAIATPDEAIAAHLSFVQSELNQLVAEHGWHAHHRLRTLIVHLRRVSVLSRDHGGPSVLDGAASLAIEAVHALGATEGGDPAARHVALSAVELCLKARREPSEFSQGGFVAGAFQGRDADSEDVQLDGELGRLQETWRSVAPPAASNPGAEAIGTFGRHECGEDHSSRGLYHDG